MNETQPYRILLTARGEEVWLFVLVKLVGRAVGCATFITLYRHC